MQLGWGRLIYTSNTRATGAVCMCSELLGGTVLRCQWLLSPLSDRSKKFYFGYMGASNGQKQTLSSSSNTDHPCYSVGWRSFENCHMALSTCLTITLLRSAISRHSRTYASHNSNQYGSSFFGSSTPRLQRARTSKIGYCGQRSNAG